MAAPASDEDLELRYLLPLDGLPRATVRTDYLFQGARLEIEGRVILAAGTREALERGVTGQLEGGHTLEMKLSASGGDRIIELSVDGERAPPEERLRIAPSRSAWIHAFQALAGSAFGFISSWLYMHKADLLDSVWARKMGIHTAGWHLLLTFTLFPLSVWGQRFGIRTVQVVSLVFFVIHAGIALSNAGSTEAAREIAALDGWIAAFNALSGVAFGIAVVYGQRAYRDMDPVARLRGR